MENEELATWLDARWDAVLEEDDSGGAGHELDRFVNSPV